MSIQKHSFRPQVLGAFGLPMGLLMVLCAGGELVTGNMAVVTAAVAAKKATMGQLARNWAVAYGGNLIGSVLVAWLASVSATGVGAGAARTPGAHTYLVPNLLH